MFAKAYMGRKRILQMLSLHVQGLLPRATATQDLTITS
jgi:hypothetical protein